MKKKFWLLFTILFSLAISFMTTTNNANAVAYGARSYTTPRATRGTWYFKSHKNIAAMPATVLYKKIRITKHSITFYARTSAGLHGRYLLRKTPRKWPSGKKQIAAERYAERHHWMSPRNMTRHSFDYSSYWLYSYDGPCYGNIKAKHGRLVVMTSSASRDTFVK